MKETPVYSKFMQSIKTTQEADDFASKISFLISSLFQSASSFDKILESVGATTAEKIKGFCRKNKLDIDNREQISGFLENLKQNLKEFKVIKLILAFDPSSKTIEKIYNFVKDEIGNGYILDIEVKESILAGAIVMYNGKYQDFSLKKTLEETFVNKKEKILKFIR